LVGASSLDFSNKLKVGKKLLLLDSNCTWALVMGHDLAKNGLNPKLTVYWGGTSDKLSLAVYKKLKTPQNPKGQFRVSTPLSHSLSGECVHVLVPVARFCSSGPVSLLCMLASQGCTQPFS
jgi:hypothetical protein